MVLIQNKKHYIVKKLINSMSRKKNNSTPFIKPVILIMAITLLSKITGFFREIILTREYGFSSILDSFYLVPDRKALKAFK